MGRRTFENYGRLARAGVDPTQATMRYPCQERDERLVIADIVEKLEIVPDDDLLEVGCGVGTNLIPLAFMCRSVTGLDHEAVVAAMKQRFPGPPDIATVAGNFLDLDVGTRYSKVLVYGVLHCLANMAEVVSFVNKAADLVEPGGRLLLGDLPNADKKQRFLSTEDGAAFQADWEQRRAQDVDQTFVEYDDDADIIGAFSDVTIAQLLGELRDRGFESYLLPQPPDLPFGRTREDILAVRYAT